MKHKFYKELLNLFMVFPFVNDILTLLDLPPKKPTTEKKTSVSREQWTYARQ